LNSFESGVPSRFRVDANTNTNLSPVHSLYNCRAPAKWKQAAEKRCQRRNSTDRDWTSRAERSQARSQPQG
jgi:hypothetical protein